MGNIRIDQNLRSIKPARYPDDRIALETKLQNEGCRNPLVIASWPGGEALADGYTRHDICTRLNIPFTTTTIHLESREHVELWIREELITNRLTDDQRDMIWDEIIEQRVETANDRAAERGREGGWSRAATR